MATFRFVSKLQATNSQQNAISYIENEKKTFNKNFGENSQQTSIDYIVNEEKTKNENWLKEVFTHNDNIDHSEDKEFFVSGIMCNKDNAHKAMLKCHQFSDKPVINYGYHAVQSFLEGDGEMSPELAHHIGIRTMEELFGNEFMILVATHLNTDHFHNHFIICATSPITGKRFHKCDETQMMIRKKSDELCREYGLHTLPYLTKYAKDRNGVQGKMEKKGIPTHRELFKNDCDLAIHKATDWSDFLNILRSMGYQISKSNKFVALKAVGWERPVRIYYDKNNNRSLGSDYTMERIIERIESKDHAVPSLPHRSPDIYFDDEMEEFDYEYQKNKSSFGSYQSYHANSSADFESVTITPKIQRLKFNGKINESRRVKGGLNITYYRLSYKLCIVCRPSQPKRKRRISLYMRREINKLHHYIEQVNFIGTSGIKDTNDLAFYKDYAQSQLAVLDEQRNLLRRKYRTLGGKTSQVKNDIEQLTSNIRTLKKRIDMCDEIAENSHNICKSLDKDSLIEKERGENIKPTTKSADATKDERRNLK